MRVDLHHTEPQVVAAATHHVSHGGVNQVASPGDEVADSTVVLLDVLQVVVMAAEVAGGEEEKEKEEEEEVHD